MAQKPSDAFADALSYATDAGQRLVLFLDALRQRGLQYEEHLAQLAPNVLDYDAELVCDGRNLARPVNYVLVRIVPPQGTVIDTSRRPFVIVDPRAGHGPGIGGFKADSEIGVAMKAGHPCYFVGFLPEAVPGQTIEDIALAEAVFLEAVIARHPEADGKPCVVGNCQAGWAVMILAALRPELFGPIILAGSPLSYWAGVKGQNPMRYAGGLLGGSWLTALTSDLGAGTFDGAWLVQNFENQNPANTLWSKQYNLYSKIDTEVERYLGFEKWWGGHVTLNAEEIQFIVDELFIGNRLACGEIRASDGTAIDLRNIRSPIVVFCSKGDNITPPQQALDWILDLYGSVDEIRSYGQTIVYAIHDKIGHLGIFVSAGVARKEHDEFASNIDFIDVLPPGLYEAVFEPKGGAEANPDLVSGEWVMRCEARTLDDIRALGGNDLDDERRFATAARVSEVNLSLYRALVQPWVQATANPVMAQAMRALHPLRLQYEVFGTRNPFLSWLDMAAPQARLERQPVADDNVFLKMQEAASEQIVSALDSWRQMVEQMSEQVFRGVYGSPLLQSAVGIDANVKHRPRSAPKSKLHAELLAKRIDELRTGMASGDMLHACVRALLYVGMARESADERSFEAIRRLRRQGEHARRLTLSEFKSLTREQFFMLLIDQAEALRTLPGLLPPDRDARAAAFKLVEQVATARGPLSGEAAERLEEVRRLFELASPMGANPPGKLHVAARRGA
ncbi:Poly(3-hydroxyalkanoate) synthetase [Hyphomicrobiales bacterium]|nr:Poly(3-hydroxyalkanoate) synthetase [Hyphomicrobiales bacterium]CAH1699624.1 Poly(3-hydroxyalkanoate) synthetase [Hyphomicrobiales bacterium]CAI0343359.1 Poly(3-hydroxyalkanoate) synthetase [Hyphomicrobiales bacterium]